MKNTSQVAGVFEAALEVGRRRRDLLEQMRKALENHNDQEALRLAKQLCGLEDEQKRNPTSAGIN
jgi:hypothetical protein